MLSRTRAGLPGARVRHHDRDNRCGTRSASSPWRPTG